MSDSRSSARTLKKVAAVSPRRRSSSPVSFFNRLRAFKSEDWSRIQKTHMLSLFKRMSREVPAYCRFLKASGVQSDHIRTTKDFAAIPAISKTNYLRKNSFPDLFWRGSMQAPHILTSTSGSTGKPTYFARSHEVDEHSSLIHELIFRTSSLKPEKSTLVIVCFGMGIWIGGVITYQAFERMSRRGYPLAILTPGINKAEILKALTDLAPQYEQIILAGYPPFLKDVIDEALAHGISFAKHRVKLLFAAEAFTENFRDYLVEKVGLKNPLTDAINIYGSADIGTMAFETPFSILARRLALKDDKLFADLFRGTAKTPTLAQFIPDSVSFEAPNGEILLSGDSALPLLRYSIGDHGGVYTFNELIERYKTHGVDLLKEARTAGIRNCVYELPFVYVYERIDLATTLYGLQVYPETVKEVLLDKRFNAHLTGKLTLITKYDHNQDQYLEINLERKPNTETSKVFTSELLAEIMKNLREKNSEFHELSDFLGKRAEPKLVFWPYEDPLYFKPGVKQSWVVRPS
ncbi:MAG: phenylacetate--CoA ligase family protein [Minisyncoccota bacterium]